MDEIDKLKIKVEVLKETLEASYSENAELKAELSKLKYKERVYSYEDYNKLMDRFKKSEENESKSKREYALLKDRFDSAKKDIIDLQSRYNSLDLKYNSLQTQHSELQVKCDELMENQNKQTKIHNERGAGRKPLSMDIVKCIQELKNEGRTIKEIQDTLLSQGTKISVGAIHKAISKINNDIASK